jgi:transposase-like protein
MFSMTPPKELITAKHSLSNQQKVVAHKLVMGATVRMVSQDMGVSEQLIEKWTWSRLFLEYMAKLEKRFYDQLEKQILSLRRAAFRVLEQSLSSEDSMEKRWAVEKVLHATEDKTMNLNINDGRADDRPALSDKAKEGAKAYLEGLAENRDKFFNNVN